MDPAQILHQEWSTEDFLWNPVTYEAQKWPTTQNDLACPVLSVRSEEFLQLDKPACFTEAPHPVHTFGSSRLGEQKHWAQDSNATMGTAPPVGEPVEQLLCQVGGHALEWGCPMGILVQWLWLRMSILFKGDGECRTAARDKTWPKQGQSSRLLIKCQACALLLYLKILVLIMVFSNCTASCT